METLFPPFEPESPRERGRRFRAIPLRVLIPNLITLLALCAGMTAIRLAIEGRLELAVGCIVVAAFLDGIDGRLARYLEGTSRFGAELDSLADFVNFGVVPPIVLYFWGLHDLQVPRLDRARLVFAMCMVLRLARFNVMLNDPNRPAYTANFFVGMPAPAGALAVASADLSRLSSVSSMCPAAAPFEFAYVLLIAFLTASRIPTFSGKKLGAQGLPGMGPAALRRCGRPGAAADLLPMGDVDGDHHRLPCRDSFRREALSRAEARARRATR